MRGHADRARAVTTLMERAVARRRANARAGGRRTGVQAELPRVMRNAGQRAVAHAFPAEFGRGGLSEDDGTRFPKARDHDVIGSRDVTLAQVCAAFKRHAAHGFEVLDGHGNAVQRSHGGFFGQRTVGYRRSVHRLLRSQISEGVQLGFQCGDAVQHGRRDFDGGQFFRADRARKLRCRRETEVGPIHGSASALDGSAGNHRRIVGLDRRQIAIETLDLDGGQLPGAALRQGRCTDVPRQDVRIAVHAKRGFFFAIGGIVPGAGWKLDDPAPDVLGHAYARQAGTARIEQANDVAVGNAARRGIGRMHARDLASAVLRARAVATEIELAVQPCRRLVGDQESAASMALASERVQARSDDRDSPAPESSQWPQRKSRSCRWASAACVLPDRRGNGEAVRRRQPACGRIRPSPAQNSSKLGAGKSLSANAFLVGS